MCVLAILTVVQLRHKAWGFVGTCVEGQRSTAIKQFKVVFYEDCVQQEYYKKVPLKRQAAFCCSDE